MSFSKRILIPIAFSMALLTLRIIVTGELTYIFLAWNLFLAWIPFALSCQLRHIKNRGVVFLVLAGWLLFFPNAPYIITDFLHLKQRPPVPYWFDILLLFSAALNGLLLGLASLVTVERFLINRYGKQWTAFIVFCSFFLCSFGIYIGRYLRWNSWDIILNPGEIAYDLIKRVINPFDHIQTWSVTLLFGCFLYVVYYSIKNLLITKSNQL